MELDGLRLEEDGGGSASLTLAELSTRLQSSVGTDLGLLLTRPVEVVGVRIVDGDGRELDPSRTVVIFGFRSDALRDGPRSSEDKGEDG